MHLSVFKIINKTKVEGPGERFCIWVQGCNRKCKGCFATNTWDKEKGKQVPINELYKTILNEKDIEGVTFLGGEPFEQAAALAHLAKKVQKTGLSVVTFTGYKLEELIAQKDKNVDNLLKYTDLLIDGPFEEENFDLSRPWVGSKNKRYLFLSERYSLADIENVKNKAEIRIDKNGFIFINGMGDFNQIKQHLCLHTC